MSNIAIFGGTFDPIHLGHLIIAEQAYNNFNLDQIIFMPAGNPPHKYFMEIADREHRLAMLRLAIKDNPNFSVSQWELAKEGRSYTVDTLRHLREEGIGETIYFIIGADTLLDIFNWKEPDYLLNYADYIVAKRPGYTVQEEIIQDKFIAYQEHIHIMDSLQVDISSTYIKELITKGKSTKYLTPLEVVKYIKENRLYRGD